MSIPAKKPPYIGHAITIIGALVFMGVILTRALMPFIQTVAQSPCMHFDVHQPDAGIKACTSIIEAGTVEPKKLAAALTNRCYAYGIKDEYDLALKDCDRAIEIDPDNAAAFINRGLAHTELKKPDEAIKDFTEANRLKPNDALILSDRGFAYGENGQIDLALKDLDQALQINPNNESALASRGTVYNAQKDYEKALQDLDLAIRIEPNDTRAYAGRALAHLSTHEYDKAIEDCNVAITLLAAQPKAIPFIMALRSEAYFCKGMNDNANKDLEDAFRLDPDNTAAYSVRSSEYFNTGDYAKAVADADQAVRTDASGSGEYFARGIFKLYNGAADAAIDDITTSIKLAKPDDEKTTYVLWLHLARLHAGQNDQQEFEHNSIQPLPDKWPFPLLALYRGTASVEDTFAKAKIGNEREQRDHACEAYFYFGEFYFFKGQTDAAKPLFQKAKSDCPPDFMEYGTALAELKKMGN